MTHVPYTQLNIQQYAGYFRDEWAWLKRGSGRGFGVNYISLNDTSISVLVVVRLTILPFPYLNCDSPAETP